MLSEAFPNASIVVPFRAPAAQAMSLWQQHRRFCSPEHDSGFTRRYMGWLAHHEFGPGHRPFVFGGSKPLGDPDEDLEYWMELWIAAYSFILKQAPDRTLFVSYDRLCRDTDQVWPRLCAALNLPPSEAQEALRAPAPAAQVKADPRIMAKAEALHSELLTRAL